MYNVLALLSHIQVFHPFGYYFLLLFISILSPIQLGSGQFQVFGPDQPIQALVGEDVLFSCHLSPKMSVEDMEVRFFRNQFVSVIFLYKDGKEEDERQMQEYQGRTQFVQDYITEGRVSLKLKNITPSDVGKYGCWFRSQTFYEGHTWELQVAALGSNPLISLEGYRDGDILLLCQSGGWLPSPEVQWRNDQGQHFSSSYTVNKDDSGLFSIETRINIKEHFIKRISCSVLNPDLKKEKESRVQITDQFFQTSSWIYVSLVMMFLISAALVCFVYTYNDKGKIKKILDFEKKLKEAEWIKAKRFSVEITLDPSTAHPRLRVSEDKKLVTYEETELDVLQNEDRFQFPCVVASQSFSSDQCYWEVEVGKMRRWYLGVCCADVNRKEKEVTFSPEKGYWILGLWNDYEYFIFNPNRKALSLPVQIRRVGVFLKYKKRKVSFFSVTERSHIYTFTDCDFREKPLYPYFCPHKNDNQEYPTPMYIPIISP